MKHAIRHKISTRNRKEDMYDKHPEQSRTTSPQITSFYYDNDEWIQRKEWYCCWRTGGYDIQDNLVYIKNPKLEIQNPNKSCFKKKTGATGTGGKILNRCIVSEPEYRVLGCIGNILHCRTDHQKGACSSAYGSLLLSMSKQPTIQRAVPGKELLFLCLCSSLLLLYLFLSFSLISTADRH